MQPEWKVDWQGTNFTFTKCSIDANDKEFLVVDPRGKHRGNINKN